MNDTFTLDVVQASELKYAWSRNGGTNADLKTLCSGDMVAKIIPVLRGYGQVVVNLLQLVGEVVFPGATNFVASQHFVKDTTPNAKVKLVFIGDNFISWFLGKIEEQVPAGVLNYGKLLRRSLDEPIISSLGGEQKAETSLVEVFHLLSLQPKGEDGVLLTNGYANIFYVCDTSGTLRVVRVRWRSDGWYVAAGATSHPHEWLDGDRVFSRKVA